MNHLCAEYRAVLNVTFFVAYADKLLPLCATIILNDRAMSSLHIRSLAAVLLLFAAVPLMVADHLPLHDYPNHLARLHMLANWQAQPIFQIHYELGNFLIPNIAMDVLMLGLATVLPLELSGKIFLWLSLVLTLTGVMALHRALFGKLSVIPLVSALFLYNGILVWGFVNYLFGVGVLLWALALYIRLQSSPWQQPLAFVFALLLFFAHLVAFGLYGLAVAGYELQRAWSSSAPTWTKFKRLCIAGLQFVAPMILMLLSRTSQEHSTFEFTQSPLQKLQFVARTFVTYSVLAELLLVSLALLGIYLMFNKRPAFTLRRRYVLLIILSILSFLVLPFSYFGSFFLDARTTIYSILAELMLVILALLGGYLVFSKRSVVTINRSFALSLVLPSLAFLMLPFSFFGSFFLDARIPICIIFLLIAASSARFSNLKMERTFVVVLLAGAVLRFGVIAIQWHESDSYLNATTQMFDQMQPNDVLITAMSPPVTMRDNLEKWQTPLDFAAAYATIMRGTFVPSIFADPRHQPVYVALQYKALYEYQSQLPKFVTSQEDFRALVADLKRFQSLGDSFYVLLLNCNHLAIRDELTFSMVRNNHRECLFRITWQEIAMK